MKWEPLEVGTLLQGRYKIVRSIEQGGMGAVYEAADTQAEGARCAVKQILVEAGDSHTAQYIWNRFHEEVQSLAALDHPSIPKVRDFFDLEGVRYIVMDFIQGANLEEELEQSLALTDRPMAPELVVHDMLQLLDVLGYLHRHKPAIVHRDVKPANLIRDAQRGHIVLVDFGLAKRLSHEVQTSVGTLGYCPPEQAVGRAEPRSDLFSVGMTMSTLLTGQLPSKTYFGPVRPELPGVRPGLAQIVEKATQIKPIDRYFTATDMADDLKRWLTRPAATTPAAVAMETTPSAARQETPALIVAAPEPVPELQPEPPAEPPEPTPVRRPELLWLASGILLLGIGLLVGKMVSAQAPSPVASATASPTPRPVPIAVVKHPAQKIPAPPPPPRPTQRKPHHPPPRVAEATPTPRPVVKHVPAPPPPPAYPTRKDSGLRSRPEPPPPPADEGVVPLQPEHLLLLPDAPGFQRSSPATDCVAYRHGNASLTVRLCQVPGVSPRQILGHPAQAFRYYPLPAGWQPTGNLALSNGRTVKGSFQGSHSLGQAEIRVHHDPGGALVCLLVYEVTNSAELPMLLELGEQLRFKRRL